MPTAEAVCWAPSSPNATITILGCVCQSWKWPRNKDIKDDTCSKSRWLVSLGRGRVGHRMEGSKGPLLTERMLSVAHAMLLLMKLMSLWFCWVLQFIFKYSLWVRYHYFTTWNWGSEGGSNWIKIVKWREWGTSPNPPFICVGNASLCGWAGKAADTPQPKLAMNYSPHLAWLSSETPRTKRDFVSSLFLSARVRGRSLGSISSRNS